MTKRFSSSFVIPSTFVIRHSSLSMRLELNPNEGNLGFQIAPMIDVVFVIMLFFMVMAGAVKVENELNTQLARDRRDLELDRFRRRTDHHHFRHRRDVA